MDQAGSGLSGNEAGYWSSVRRRAWDRSKPDSECTPLTKTTAAVLKTWLAEPTTRNTEIVFPTASGARLSPDSVKDLVDKHVALARQTCPSLRTKRVTPHVLRHTMAMQLLQAGVDRAIIALWLGHESVETTQIYLDANLTLKIPSASLLPHYMHYGTASDAIRE